MSSPYKSPEPPVISGEGVWTAEGTHPHHASGTSQVWAYALIHGPSWGDKDSNRIIGALGAHLDHSESGPTWGMARGAYPWYKCT